MPKGKNVSFEVFAEKIRNAYLEVFGDNPFNEDIIEAGAEPFTLGTVLVAIEANHVDGEHSSIVLYDGSRMAALGLAVRSQDILVGDDE